MTARPVGSPAGRSEARRSENVPMSAPAGPDPSLPPVEIVRAALAEHGLHDRIHEFTVDVPTAVAAAEHLGCDLGAIANSLVFRAGDEPVLVMSSGAHRVDVSMAGPAFGVERLRRADAATVLAATGQEVGGCAPLGHPCVLRTVVDSDLAGYERLWAGAGEKHAMLWLTYDELLTITGGIPARVA